MLHFDDFPVRKEGRYGKFPRKLFVEKLKLNFIGVLVVKGCEKKLTEKKRNRYKRGVSIT
jgi:hypothetical protein